MGLQPIKIDLAGLTIPEINAKRLQTADKLCTQAYQFGIRYAQEQGHKIDKKVLRSIEQIIDENLKKATQCQEQFDLRKIVLRQITIRGRVLTLAKSGQQQINQNVDENKSRIRALEQCMNSTSFDITSLSNVDLYNQMPLEKLKSLHKDITKDIELWQDLVVQSK